MNEKKRFQDISYGGMLKISEQAITEAHNLVHKEHDGPCEDDKRSPMLKAQPPEYHLNVRKWLVKRIQDK